MLKWLVALFLLVVLLGSAQPRLLSLLRLGRLPGDLRLRLRGREYLFPFATTLLLSVVVTLLARLL